MGFECEVMHKWERAICWQIRVAGSRPDFEVRISDANPTDGRKGSVLERPCHREAKRPA